jgi:RHS repeat-associated protein
VTGGVTSITTPSGTINYAYDPATGNHVETWTDSNQTLYGYNALGQLSTVTVTELNGTNLATPQVTTYTDDYNGNLKTVAQADGVTTTFTFDKLNRLTTEVATGSTGAVVASYVYTLASDGSRLTVLEHQEETNGTFSDVQVSYEYDGDGQLTREFDDASSGTSASGQPIFSTTGVPDSAGDFCDSYTYDLASNRLSKTHVTTAGTETTSNTYNADDQLTKSVDSVSGMSTYAYDPNGSQTNDGAHKYVYDLRNRLVEVTDESNNAIASYTYDDAGNRVSETTGGSGGATTFYVIDANNPSGYPKPIEQWVSATGSRADATLVVSYILGSAVIGQADSSGAVSYLLTDRHGSTRALLSSSGVVMKTFNYDAYGNAVGFDPATAGTAWLFGGDGMYDAPSGLTFHGSGRQTDSETGLFVEADPPGHGSKNDPITLHKYLYAGADPINSWDPSGHDLTETLIVTGLIGAIAGIAFNGIGNYSQGLPFFKNAIYAGSLGAVLAPLSVLFPPVGIALAGLGIAGSSANAYSVLTNPNSSLGQDGAAVFLVLASAWGGRASISRFQQEGWYAPLGPKLPTASPITLSSKSTLAELLPQLNDDALIHLSPTQPENLVGGGIRPGSYWARFGDVKNYSFEDFQTDVIGPAARGSTNEARTIYVARPGSGAFTKQPSGWVSGLPEYTNDNVFAPDLDVILNLP